MNIYGIGTDISEISRIEEMLARHGETFKSMTFTPTEIGYCESRKMYSESYTGRWCAKEAILKALGTGWSNGIKWTDMEIRTLVSGQPVVAVGGMVAQMVRELGISDILITLSHCKTYATATAIIITDSEKEFDPQRILR